MHDVVAVLERERRDRHHLERQHVLAGLDAEGLVDLLRLVEDDLLLALDHGRVTGRGRRRGAGEGRHRFVSAFYAPHLAPFGPETRLGSGVGQDTRRRVLWSPRSGVFLGPPRRSVPGASPATLDELGRVAGRLDRFAGLAEPVARDVERGAVDGLTRR